MQNFNNDEKINMQRQKITNLVIEFLKIQHPNLEISDLDLEKINSKVENLSISELLEREQELKNKINVCQKRLETFEKINAFFMKKYNHIPVIEMQEIRNVLFTLSSEQLNNLIRKLNQKLKSESAQNDEKLADSSPDTDLTSLLLPEENQKPDSPDFIPLNPPVEPENVQTPQIQEPNEQTVEEQKGEEEKKENPTPAPQPEKKKKKKQSILSDPSLKKAHDNYEKNVKDFQKNFGKIFPVIVKGVSLYTILLGLAGALPFAPAISGALAFGAIFTFIFAELILDPIIPAIVKTIKKTFKLAKKITKGFFKLLAKPFTLIFRKKKAKAHTYANPIAIEVLENNASSQENNFNTMPILETMHKQNQFLGEQNSKNGKFSKLKSGLQHIKKSPTTTPISMQNNNDLGMSL